MIEETKQGMKVEKKRDMKAAKQKKRQRREEERKKRKNYSPRIKIATLTINFTPGNVQKKLSGVGVSRKVHCALAQRSARKPA